MSLAAGATSPGKRFLNWRKMLTIIVTGGAGFIGSNFVRLALIKRDWRVVVIDKLTYAGSPLNLREVEDDPRYSFIHSDIADQEAVTEALDRWQPDLIVNFAAETHVDRSIDGPRSFMMSNVIGTFELLEATRHYWSRLGPLRRRNFRFLQISTDEVYGSLGDTGSFKEDSSYAPNSPYASSKAAADHLVRSYNKTFGLPTLISHCSNNYGFNQFPEKLIPLTILKATAGRFYSGLRRWPEHSGLGVCRRPLRSAFGNSRARTSRRTVQCWRKVRAHEPRGGERSLCRARGTSACR